MKALSLRTTISADGTIDLRVPSGLPPGEADVVIVVQPAIPALSNGEGPPYQSDHGVWQGLLPDIDLDAELRDMNRLWEKGMDCPSELAAAVLHGYARDLLAAHRFAETFGCRGAGV